MQIRGIASLLGCTLSMGGLYFELTTVGLSIFILSVVMMTISFSLAL